MKTFLLGDIHGDTQVLHRAVDNYLKPAKEQYPDARLIQLGDFGFADSWAVLHVSGYDPKDVQVIGGNHDNYDYLAKSAPPHYLGDFGMIEGAEHPTFFVRGAWSIDKDYRIEGRSWWAEEELGMDAGYRAFDMYCEVKPRVVLSHDCPMTVVHAIHGDVIPTRTGHLLQRMFDEHEPEQWLFGHHHVYFQRKIGGTDFRCVNINELVETDL